jgi:hypothetical protein
LKEPIMTKHKIWEMIAPNGKPLGECTQEELGQFAEWLTWLAREARTCTASSTRQKTIAPRSN